MQNINSKKVLYINDILIIVTLLIAILYYYYYYELTWGIPFRYYGGDDIYMLAAIKAYASGDFFPFFQKTFDALNAPFGANWNDFPSPDFVFVFPAIFVGLFGPTIGSSIYMILIQIMAALSFYFSGRLIDYKRAPLIIGSLLFACAPYIFYRSIGHLTLTTLWHLPLILITIVYIIQPDRFIISKKKMILVTCLTALFAGMFKEYYLYVFLWLMGLLMLGQIINKKYSELKYSFVLIGISMIVFFLSHLDTISFQMINGANPEGMGRGIKQLISYGLKLPDMIFPVHHQIGFVQELSDKIYHSRIERIGSPSYIGMIGVIGFTGLILSGTTLLAAKKFDKVSIWYWLALAITALALVGGINYLIGSFGLIVVRATGRFSIFLLIISLYFCVEYLTFRKSSKFENAFLFLLILPLGVIDQIPDFPKLIGKERTKLMYENDVKLVASLEATLPENAQIFQYPVKKMMGGSKNHGLLRPYLHSKSFKYSYGTMKGRADANWQDDLELFKPHDMVSTLESFGFSAILVNKKYLDVSQKSISEEFKKLNLPVIIDLSEYICFKINPADNRQLPDISPYNISYDKDFYRMEKSGTSKWRWAKSKTAEIVLHKTYFPKSYTKVKNSEVILSFEISSLKRANVWMQINDRPRQLVLSKTDKRNQMKLAIPFDGEEKRLKFITNSAPSFPKKGKENSLFDWII